MFDPKICISAAGSTSELGLQLGFEVCREVAVINISGHIGMLNKSTSEFGGHKLIRVLLHSEDISDDIPQILEYSKQGLDKGIMEKDPRTLGAAVMQTLEQGLHV